MSEPLLTLDDLCTRLRCKKSWARAQLEARRWPITWVAKSYRFTEDDYQQILRILAEPPAEQRRRQRRPQMQGARAASRTKRPLKG